MLSRSFVCFVIAMGIVGFNDLFTASQVKVPKASSSHVFIDANLYWLKLRTHQMGARFANLTTSEFSAEFVDFVCADLLQFELLKSDDLYRQEARTIELIFDSKFSRNFMKMWRCYRRAETNVRTSKDVRVEADYAMLEYYLEELRAALHLRYSQYDENAVGLIKIKEAEMDTDEYIVSRCHQLLEQEEERGTRELVLVSPDSSLQNTFVSRISIFSDDTDFVSFFPSCQRAGVYSIRRSEYGESEVFLLNAAINHSHPVIKDLDELSDRLARTYSRIEREYVFRLALKVYAMLSANDYISCSFFDIRYLRQAFESVFLWYRGPLGVVKTPLPPRHPLKRKIDYCDDSETEAPETGANKRNVEAVADKRSVNSGEGPAKKRRVGERGESANVASTAIKAVDGNEAAKAVDGNEAAKAVDTAVRGAKAVDTAVRGAEAVDTAVRGAEELALIMNELPLTCVFAYWMCYLDGIKSDGAAARKHLALVNNILRIFIVQFTEPPVFTAEAALLKFVDGPLKEQPPETSGGGGLLSLDQKVSLSLFEFQNVSKTALTASAAPPGKYLFFNTHSLTNSKFAVSLSHTSSLVAHDRGTGLRPFQPLAHILRSAVLFVSREQL
ncbi:MAG: hypothetical protein E6Q06_01970 [Candidatus Moraniibacteriota bacterium]|nr:MAG: hypothetical protein E6Q06_01970 [Candidatus Moranbacteria bacterium]